MHPDTRHLPSPPVLADAAPFRPMRLGCQKPLQQAESHPPESAFQKAQQANRAASEGEKYPPDGEQAIWAFGTMGDNSGTTAQEGKASVTKPPDRLMRLKEVLELTSLRRTTLYSKIQAGTFPRQVRISDRGSAWRESAIRNWLDNPASWSAGDT